MKELSFLTRIWNSIKLVLEPNSVTMTETRSFSSLNDKINILSSTTDQHEQEIREIHQKLDAVTSVLQALIETVQGLTDACQKL